MSGRSHYDLSQMNVLSVPMNNVSTGISYAMRRCDLIASSIPVS